MLWGNSMGAILFCEDPMLLYSNNHRLHMNCYYDSDLLIIVSSWLLIMKHKEFSCGLLEIAYTYLAAIYLFGTH
jgi:hypothetical protein